MPDLSYIGNPISKRVEHNYIIAFNPFFGSQIWAVKSDLFIDVVGIFRRSQSSPCRPFGGGES